MFQPSSFDFVLSIIALQHVPSKRLIWFYLKEFLRVTRPEGLVVFQLPSHIPVRARVQMRRRVWHVLRALGFSGASLFQRGLTPMSMRAIEEGEVRKVLTAHGGNVVRIKRDEWTGHGNEDRTYFVTPTITHRVAAENA